MILMPRETARMHLDPYWLGDSPRAIKQCALRRPGHRYIDLNLQRCKDGIIVMHWATPLKGGWNYIQQPNGHRRRMTFQERHRPLHDWTVSQVLTFRQTSVVDKSYQSKVKPMSFEQAVRLCKKLYVRPCFELKSPGFADDTCAKYMVSYAKANGRVVFYMTLATMIGWRQKGLAIHKAGGQIALLAHGSPKPADLYTYVPNVFERVWGSWA